MNQPPHTHTYIQTFRKLYKVDFVCSIVTQFVTHYFIVYNPNCVFILPLWIDRLSQKPNRECDFKYAFISGHNWLQTPFNNLTMCLWLSSILSVDWFFIPHLSSFCNNVSLYFRFAGWRCFCFFFVLFLCCISSLPVSLLSQFVSNARSPYHVVPR